MPYDAAKKDSLPASVQKLGAAQRKQWVAVFNRLVASGSKESDAIAQANGVAMKKKANQAAELSTADMNNLPDSAFLYIKPGGEKDEDGRTKPRDLRMFPYKDAEGKVDLPHLRNALARIPDSSMPDNEKSALTKKAQGILAKSDSKGASEKKDEDEESDDDDEMDMSDPGVNAVHVDAPLSTTKKPGRTTAYIAHLMSQIKKTGRFSDAEMYSMVKVARSHAGGKGKQKSAAETVGNGSLTAKVNLVQSAINSEFNKPSPFSGYSSWASTEAIFDDYAIIRADDGTMYRCDYTIDGDSVIFGDPQEVVEQYIAAREMADICANENGFALFMELPKISAEAPEWIPYLPKPGEYTHKEYGKIKISKARNQRFVDNFNNNVYQEHIPIDAEHETKLSGAFGYPRELRMNDDDSVEGRIEWTDRGKRAFTDERFKYFSPQWFDNWVDPMTEESHKDIIVGGALTTRPFFKEKALRPLIANESGISFLDSETIDEESSSHFYFFSAATPISMPGDLPVNPKGGTMPEVDNAPPVIAGGVIEDQSQRFTELQATVNEQATQLKTMAEQKAAADAQVKQMSEKVAKIEKEAQIKRFSDEIAGRAEGGIQWVGKGDKHLTKLEQIAEKFGEESEFFTEYVEEQRAHARQLEEAHMFGEVGSDAVEVNPTTATGKLKTMAEQLQKNDPKLTDEQAIVQALERNPDLYKKYNQELARGVN